MVARLLFGFSSSSTLGSDPNVPVVTRRINRRKMRTGLSNSTHIHLVYLEFFCTNGDKVFRVKVAKRAHPRREINKLYHLRMVYNMQICVVNNMVALEDDLR
jgi:hypothetical protein